MQETYDGPEGKQGRLAKALVVAASPHDNLEFTAHKHQGGQS